MQKSLIYCRVSSVKQKKEGQGLVSQEHRCREYAERKGYKVEKVFRDSFTGGGDFLKRPAMFDLLGYLEKKPHVDYVVIFDDLKRFARDIVFHWKLRNELSARGASVECLNFTFEDTPEGKFIETILAGHGQLEREQNKRQVIQKMKAGLEQGRWSLGGTAPPGYRREKRIGGGKHLVIDKSVAKIVREAFEGYASGRFDTQEDVRVFLKENNFKKGKPVYLETVKRLLRRFMYTGYIEYPHWEVARVKGEHDAIISLELFNKVQEKLDGKVTTHTKKFINPDFPLRGFVLCSECRELVTASWSTGRSGKFAYYRCRNNDCTERNKSINKSVIEKDFEAILSKINPEQRALDVTKAVVADIWKKKEVVITKRLQEQESILRKLQSEKDSLLRRINLTLNEDVIRAYEDRLSEVIQKEAVQRSLVMSSKTDSPCIETALEIVFDFLKNPLVEWKKGDIGTQKLLLKLVFEEKLAYNKNSGFETAILSLPLRVFTLPEEQNACLVEMGGIEPPCNRDFCGESTGRSLP